MRLNLSSGQEAHLRIKYILPELPNAGRITLVSLNTSDRIFYASTRCSPQDRFERKVGRKIAAERLLERLRNEAFYTISKEDRARIFELACPEFKR